MGSEEENAFLTHLEVEGQASAATQNQILSTKALASLLCVYVKLIR